MSPSRSSEQTVPKQTDSHSERARLRYARTYLTNAVMQLERTERSAWANDVERVLSAINAELGEEGLRS